MRIYVFHQNNLVGTINKIKSEWSFEYDSTWLSNKQAFAISLNLPLENKQFGHFAAHAFFANLLPESEIRNQIARALGVSDKNDFEILKKIGGECAGALNLVTDKQKNSQDGQYQPLSKKQLLTFIKQAQQKALIHAVDQWRLSLAGAQHKLPVFKQKKQYFLPLGNYASTHILKPQCSNFKGLCENEYFCMRLAKAMGLPVADVQLSYIDQVAVLEVTRYDRIKDKSAIERLHQEDFCQAAGLSFDQKYEMEGGPSLKQCFTLIERYSAQPILDKQSLLRGVIFNYLIGNADAHAKNISFLYKNRQITLAPFYDLVSTIIYHGLTQNMAMKIGAEKRLGKVNTRHLDSLAEIAQIKSHLVISTFTQMKQELEQKSLLLAQELSKEIKTPFIIDRICQYISQQNSKKKDKF